MSNLGRNRLTDTPWTMTGSVPITQRQIQTDKTEKDKREKDRNRNSKSKKERIKNSKVERDYIFFKDLVGSMVGSGVVLISVFVFVLDFD